MAQARKTITVVGATGQQGGSVARSLLQNPEFHVRCITRNAASAKAKQLLELGAEVVEGDGYDAVHMESILRGSWGVFINNSYQLSEAVREGNYELDLGNCILRSAAKAEVQHVVFSSQPSAHELTGGRIHTPVLDAKAWGEAWGRKSPVFRTFTPIMSSWYMENFFSPAFVTGFGGFPYNKDSDGYLTFRSPTIGGNEDVPWICVDEDFGDLVHGIFLNPVRWNKRVVQAVGEILSFGDMTTVFAAVTKQKARFIPYRLDEMPVDRPDLKESRDVFAFYQLREGEIFCNGLTEKRTAEALKKAAFRAKGGKGRETMTTCEEWFEKHFTGSALQISLESNRRPGPLDQIMSADIT